MIYLKFLKAFDKLITADLEQFLLFKFQII